MKIPVIQRDLTMHKTVHYMQKPNSKIQINDESLHDETIISITATSKAHSKKIKVEVYPKGSGERLHPDKAPIPYRVSSRDVSNVGSQAGDDVNSNNDWIINRFEVESQGRNVESEKSEGLQKAQK